MRKISAAILVVHLGLAMGALGLLTPAGARAATLAGDYQLQDVYTSSTGMIGPLSPLGSQTFIPDTVMGVGQEVLNFTGTDQHGVAVQTNPFVDSSVFSIVLLASFNLNTMDPLANKIFDFKNLSSDTGLYVNSTTGLLAFNGITPLPIGGTPVVTGTYTQIVLTRDSAGLVSVYQDGVLAFSFVDTTGAVVLGDATPSGNSFLNVFTDDNDNVLGLNSESSNGNIARLRLYDGALTAAEVMALDTTAVPEPSTWTLVTCGLVFFGYAGARRRRGAAALA